MVASSQRGNTGKDVRLEAPKEEKKPQHKDTDLGNCEEDLDEGKAKYDLIRKISVFCYITSSLPMRSTPGSTTQGKSKQGQMKTPCMTVVVKVTRGSLPSPSTMTALIRVLQIIIVQR